MITTALLAASLCAAVLPPSGQPAGEAGPEALVGRWAVSLYFSPDAPPSRTEMVIETVEGGRLAGSFYGSPFEIGRVTARDGTPAFAATTSDGSGPYHHSGRLNAEGVIEGQTLSTGRDFLMMWTAECAQADPG